jgi:hypothetical protein
MYKPLNINNEIASRIFCNFIKYDKQNYLMNHCFEFNESVFFWFWSMYNWMNLKFLYENWILNEATNMLNSEYLNAHSYIWDKFLNVSKFKATLKYITFIV